MRRLKIIFLFILISFDTAALDSCVLAPVEDIKKGDPVFENSLTCITNTKSKKNNSQYITDWGQIDGQQLYAKKLLRKNHPIILNDLQKEITIQKGDQITGIYSKYNMIIEVQCMAITSGGSGDNIKLKIIETNKILTGKVLENGYISLGGD